MAGDLDVDLVEIAATAGSAGLPPDGLRQVGTRSRRRRPGQGQAKVIEVKEVKFRPAPTKATTTIKMRNLRRFIGRGRRQGQDHAALPGPRDHAPGHRHALLERRIRDELADIGGGAHAQARRPPDDHGAGAEEEAKLSRRRESGATVWSPGRCRNPGEDPAEKADKTAKDLRGRLQDGTIRRRSSHAQMKTKKSAKKRFRVRPGGTVKRGQAFKRHILTKKTTKNKRHLRRRHRARDQHGPHGRCCRSPA